MMQEPLSEIKKVDKCMSRILPLFLQEGGVFTYIKSRMDKLLKIRYESYRGWWGQVDKLEFPEYTFLS